MIQKLLAESLSCAVYAHCSITEGDSCLLGEGVKRSLAQIDFAERFAIGGLNLLEGSGDAAAEVCRGKVRSGRGGFYLRGQRLEGTRFDCTVPIMVDHCIAKDAEEPGVGGLLCLESFHLRNGSRVGALKDVFGGGTVPDSSLDKGEEALSLVGEIGEG